MSPTEYAFSKFCMLNAILFVNKYCNAGNKKPPRVIKAIRIAFITMCEIAPPAKMLSFSFRGFLFITSEDELGSTPKAMQGRESVIKLIHKI